MDDIERLLRSVIEDYSSLIRKVVQAHLFARDGADLDDIEQEIRLKLWSALKSGKNIRQLPSYIKRVAYTVTIDQVRRQRMQAPYREALEGDPSEDIAAAGRPESPLERDLERREMSARLREMILRLEGDRGRVLDLYAAGRSVEEICAATGWDKVRVRHLLYRGIEDLRARGALEGVAAATSAGKKG